MKTAVVLNPRAAAGRAGAQWPLIEAALRNELGDWTPLRTERPGHATDLVRQALRDGHDRIVSVGGDGTHHEVVNGFFDGDIAVRPEAVLAVVPIGTGSDLGRTLRLPPGVDAVPIITRGRVVHSDLGRVTYTRHNGGTTTCYFINVADFGAGGAVAERVNNSSKGMGGFWSFFKGVLTTLIHYRAPHFELEIDGEAINGRSLSVIVANAEYYGGGIHVAPRASLEDGLIDVFVLADMSIFRAMLNLRRFYVGDLYDRPRLVRPFQARRIALRSPERVLINLDGEQPGTLPATVEAIPKAIRIVMAG
ncbi:MAG: diacylglycerol kinase family lipid kinase [FCB group bacterium]|nr:diacylglycerol kinase family lipid kinase [FCB group bacterium]